MILTLDKFKEKLIELNEASWSYGNEVLYKIALDPKDIQDKKKLEGTIWLIGRAYAASPQRRSYGTTTNNIGYVNLNGDKNLKTRPIWPVKTQNDGREGFFGEIANNFDTSCIDGLIKDYHTKNLEYKFDLSDSDMKLLNTSINAVLSFNEKLSESIELFDQVPSGSDFKCNNHVSFSSKFLHFYFPNIIFIIDSFACNGGCAIFNGDEDNHKRYIETPANKEDYFKNEIYKEFQKLEINKIRLKITISPSEDPEKDEIKENDDGDNIKAANYINHCIRSYLMGCFLKNNGINPISYIKGKTDFRPMPRLTDTIFLNIKKELTKKEKDYQDLLDNIFYHPSTATSNNLH